MMPAKYTRITPSLYAYLTDKRSNSGDLLLKNLRRETIRLGDISRMQVSVEQGSFLTLLVAALNVKKAIEVGTFTGYSSLCIARGLPQNGKLLCCDVDEKWTAIARKYWIKAKEQEKRLFLFLEIKLKEYKDI